MENFFRNFPRNGKKVSTVWKTGRAGLVALLLGGAAQAGEEAVQADRIRPEQMLEGLLRSAPTGIGVVEGRVLVLVNDYILNATGYGREELVGQDARILHASDAEYESVGRELYGGMAERGIGSAEARIRCKDGRILHAILSATPLDPADVSAGIVFTVTDITARKQAETRLQESEERFKSLFENSQALMLLIDPASGAIRDANPAAVAFYGWPYDRLVGMRIQEINQLSPEEVRREMERARTAARTYFEFRHRRADGSIRDVAVFSGKIAVDREELLYSIIHDITDRKRAEADLAAGTRRFRNLLAAFAAVLLALVAWLAASLRRRRAAEAALREANASLLAAVARANDMSIRAEAASRAKSEFLATISHEIRTPLNAVIGFADLLSAEVADDRQRQRAGVIARSGRSLLRLLNDLLDLSQIEAGKLEIHPGPCSPARLLEEVRQVFDLSAKGKGLGLAVSADASLPAGLRLDEGRTRQILANLVGNAIKFTDSGSVVLSAACVRAGGDPSCRDLILTVADTGPGIPPELMPRLFGAFEQASGQDRARYGGTGLGLAISRRLAHLMNGEISVAGNPAGRGSVFTLALRGVPVAEGACGSGPVEAAAGCAARLAAREAGLLDELAAARRGLRIPQVKEVAEKLRGAGERQGSPELIRLGEELAAAAAAFQIDRIQALLAELEGGSP